MRSRRLLSVCVLIVLLASAAVVFQSPSEGAPFPYNYDKVIHVTHPGWGPGSGIWLAALTGDNISITFSNFTGYTGKSLYGQVPFSGNYYEKDDRLDDSLAFNFPLTSNKNITIWFVIAKSFEFQYYCYFTDYSSYGSFDVVITRTPTNYSAHWKDTEALRVTTEGLNDNINSLNENLTDVMDDITSLQLLTTSFGLVIDDLTLWQISVNTKFRGINDRLDELNSAIGSINTTQADLDSQLAALSAAYDDLNATLASLATDVEALQGLDLTWVEENLTSIRTQVTELLQILNDIPELQEDLNLLEVRVGKAFGSIVDLNANLTAVEDSIPDPYVDSELRDRIAALEGQNQLLQQQLDAMEDEQGEIREATPSAAVGYVALVLAVVGIVIALVVLTRKGKDQLWEES